MNRYFSILTLLALYIFLVIKLFPSFRDIFSIDTKSGFSYIAKVDTQNLYVYKYGVFKKQFVRGVNMGATKPGFFPGELAISKADYLRWFGEIAKMNANTIRVYTILPLAKYETGKLKFGNGNPKSSDFDSLSDFFIKSDDIEIRIPWQLLNIMDHSSKMSIDDLYKNGIKPMAMTGIYIGCILMKEGEVTDNLTFKKYDWS